MIQDELKYLTSKELLALANTAMDKLVSASVDPDANKHIVDQRQKDLKMIYSAIADKQTEEIIP